MEIGTFMSTWNPALYQSSHSFVWEYGRELVQLLAPQAGERVLDVGCGTGQLTHAIAESGAATVGIDLSPAMIQEARQNCPELAFAVADAASLPFRDTFDAVFSNAALHWVRNAPAAVADISRALKRGGRFVAEFGGRGNVARVTDAVYRALRDLGLSHPEELNPWHFPSVGEYAALLEQHAFEIGYTALFDRPTPLDPGGGALAKWLEMFCEPFLRAVEPSARRKFIGLVERYARPDLEQNGVWTVDYRRLRVAARRL